MAEENISKKNICPQCGAEFTCGSEVGTCWCQNFKISAENIKVLKNRYTSCLCPSCLAAFSEKSEGTSCTK